MQLISGVRSYPPNDNMRHVGNDDNAAAAATPKIHLPSILCILRRTNTRSSTINANENGLLQSVSLLCVRIMNATWPIRLYLHLVSAPCMQVLIFAHGVAAAVLINI